MSYPPADLYGFLRGPGLVISVTVFISGYIYHLIRLTAATSKIRRSSIEMENTIHDSSAALQGSFLRRTVTYMKIKFRNTIFGVNPLMGCISLVFHLLLFITPVFLSAHNVIADLTVGVSLFSIPEEISDIFTIVLIAIGGFFFARRIFVPHVRILSTAGDYLLLILVMAPFVSAFMAYHHFFNYRAVIFFHMIAGETAIMALPFTRLSHIPFTVFSRFFLESEHSIIPGNRSW